MARHDKKRAATQTTASTDELRRLVRTPVGRRLILKLGGASALALAVGNLGGCGEDEEAAPQPTPTPTPTPRPREVRHIFFALGSAAGVQNLTLSVSAATYNLQ